MEKQASQVAKHDQHAKMRNFQIGHSVMARNFRPSGPKWVQAIILKQTGPLSYIVKTESGLEWKRLVDHIKSIHSSSTYKPVSPNHTHR